MARCEAAGLAGEPLAVVEAMVLLQLYQQPPPDWVFDAVLDLAVASRTPMQARRHLAAQKDMRRYTLVWALNDADRNLDEACAEASTMLAGTFAEGGEDAMRLSYRNVEQAFKAERLGRYFMPKPIPSTKRSRMRGDRAAVDLTPPRKMR
jgi:hypothetical protein